MTLAAQNERIFERYADVDDILTIHQSIRDNLENETAKAAQCMLLIHVNDNVEHLVGYERRIQRVNIFSYPKLDTLDLEDWKINIDDLSKSCITQIYIPDDTDQVGIFSYDSSVSDICRSDLSSLGLYIPIFFPNVPSDDFTPDQLTMYLHLAVLDAIDALYASKSNQDEREATVSRINSEEYVQNLKKFSEKFLDATKNVKKGIQVDRV